MNLLILDHDCRPGPDPLRAQFDRLGHSRSWEVSVLAVGSAAAGHDVAALADLLASAPPGVDVTVLAGDVVVPDGGLLTIVEDDRNLLSALVRGRDAGGAADIGSAVDTGGAVTEAGTVLSVGTTVHPVPGADTQSLGVIRISAAGVGPAAAVLRDAARTLRDRRWDDLDVSDAVLAALVRGGLPVAAVRLDPYDGGRAESPAAATELAALVEATDEAEVARIRSTRLDDGFYSTFVLRRLSPPLTRWAVGHHVRANQVTAGSAVIGLIAAAAFAAGGWWTLLLGAVLLQASLVLDCVDGEIARATGTYSPFGAWLDAATDRVKEYAALAGLAAGAARHGHDLWLLALAGMIVQTARHMQDFSFDKGVLAAARAPRPDRRPLDDTAPFHRPAGSVPSRPVGASRALTPQMWLRRVIHLPIAERWLVLSVGAAANRPRLALAAYLVLTGLAEAWTLVGAVRRTTPTIGRYGPQLRQRLGEYRDDGLLAGLTREHSPAGRTGWVLPPLVTALEGAVLLGVVAASGADDHGWAFAWFAVVAWHRYDVVYRRRDRARPVPRAVGRAGGGWLVRAVIVLAAAAASQLPVVLVVGTVALVIVYLPESLAAGLRSRWPS